jgi:hypothetical protein
MKVWRRAILSMMVLLLASLLMHFAATATETADINPVGRPKNFRAGKKLACLVWYADGQWHLLIGAKSQQSVFFQGTVEVEEGEIVETSTSGFDKKKKRGFTDWVTVDRDKKSLKFLFRNQGLTEGFSFKVSDSAKSVKFALTVDRDTKPDRVLIGKKMVHPATNPFTLPAHPNDKGEPTTDDKSAGKDGGQESSEKVKKGDNNKVENNK